MAQPNLDATDARCLRPGAKEPMHVALGAVVHDCDAQAFGVRVVITSHLSEPGGLPGRLSDESLCEIASRGVKSGDPVASSAVANLSDHVAESSNR